MYLLHLAYLFIHQQHLRCFHFLTLVNNAAVNMPYNCFTMFCRSHVHIVPYRRLMKQYAKLLTFHQPRGKHGVTMVTIIHTFLAISLTYSYGTLVLLPHLNISQGMAHIMLRFACLLLVQESQEPALPVYSSLSIALR